MFNGTNFTLNSDLALVSTQVKTLLYIVGQKARESSDTSMSTCDGVRHIPGHWKINKALALLLHIGECSACADPEGRQGSGPPRKSQKYSFLSNTGPPKIPLKPQSYQATFQFWAIIGTSAKRHLNGDSLADRRWPLIVVFGYFLPHQTKKTLSRLDPL